MKKDFPKNKRPYGKRSHRTGFSRDEALESGYGAEAPRSARIPSFGNRLRIFKQI